MPADLPLLYVRGLDVRFGGLVALEGAELAVRSGTITGLIGPNGAGKSTLINAVTGLIKSHAGSVRFAGEEIRSWRPDQICRAGLARTFQIARGFPRLSVFENLMLHGREQSGEILWRAVSHAGVAGEEAAVRERALALARRLRLSPVINNPAGALSGGQKKLLEIGRALMSQPRLVLLDEPAAGVNPTLAREIADHLLRLRDEDGLTFLIVEHDMGLIARLCDTVVVMANGRKLTEGPFDAIRANPLVQEAYLGRSHEELVP